MFTRDTLTMLRLKSANQKTTNTRKKKLTHMNDREGIGLRLDEATQKPLTECWLARL